MTTTTQDTKLPSPEGFKQLLDVLKSFGQEQILILLKYVRRWNKIWTYIYYSRNGKTSSRISKV